jgi:pimeloyl-ACP methyl ester carboxylesterase
MSGVATVNGTQLYYEVAGQGVPVVLIHGLGLDTRMWDGQFDVLADHYRVIRYDLRGFGKSALPTDAAFRHPDDLRALLDYLEAPKAHVVGLSMGGRIALHHGLLYPDATLSLVLVDAALDGFDFSEQLDASFDAIAERANDAGAGTANEMWLQHELFAPAREQPECRAKLAQIVGESSGWNWVNKSPARGIKPPAADRLNEVHVPTLVIVGERDLPDFQRIADRLADGIPSARKVVMNGVGHMSNMEDIQEFNSIVLSFLAE